MRSDRFNAGVLVNGADLDASGVVSAKWRFRQLYQGLLRMGVEPVTEFGEDFDGAANLSGGGCLHNQMRTPREGL